VRRHVVITGIGLVTPLGQDVARVLQEIRAGNSAARGIDTFDASAFACPLYARVDDFDPNTVFPDNKTLRMMNRDALLAVTAARGAVQDAELSIGQEVPPESVALYGATGLAGLELHEFFRMVKHSADAEGKLDLQQFGRVALRRVRPVLSFKILANMPICFVSIFERIQGPNAVYTPWEDQGARAIQAALRAVGNAQVSCALVGGCDCKAHLLGLATLCQHGILESWKKEQAGPIPSEGAAFVLLEAEDFARSRGAKIYARLTRCTVAARTDAGLAGDLRHLSAGNVPPPDAVLAGADGSSHQRQDEQRVIDEMGPLSAGVVYPKDCAGNLFAAAAGLQLALAARLCFEGVARTRAHCIGQGRQIALLDLEAI
jgi:3-oxoacyl-[acyl-carrier-protein] synthase II